MQIHQGQRLELLHCGGLVAHPHHVADSLLGDIACGHGKVLGCQQILYDVHGEFVCHVRLFVGILLGLRQLLLAVDKLLLGLVQLLCRLVHLLQAALDLLFAAVQLGLGHFQLVLSHGDGSPAVGKLHRRGHLAFLNGNQAAVDVLDGFGQIRDILAGQDGIDLRHISIIAQAAGQRRQRGLHIVILPRKLEHVHGERLPCPGFRGSQRSSHRGGQGLYGLRIGQGGQGARLYVKYNCRVPRARISGCIQYLGHLLVRGGQQIQACVSHEFLPQLLDSDLGLQRRRQRLAHCQQKRALILRGIRAG